MDYDSKNLRCRRKSKAEVNDVESVKLTQALPCRRKIEKKGMADRNNSGGEEDRKGTKKKESYRGHRQQEYSEKWIKFRKSKQQEHPQRGTMKKSSRNGVF